MTSDPADVNEARTSVSLHQFCSALVSWRALPIYWILKLAYIVILLAGRPAALTAAAK